MVRRLLLLLSVIFICSTVTYEAQANEAKLKFGYYPLSGGPLYPPYEAYPHRTYWNKFMLSWGPIAIGTAVTVETGELGIFMNGVFRANGDEYYWSTWKWDAFSHFPVILKLTPYSKRWGSGNLSLGGYFRGSLWAKGNYSTLEYIHPYRNIPSYAISTDPSSYYDIGISLSYNPFQFFGPDRLSLLGLTLKIHCD